MRFADAHFTDNFISTIGIDFKVKLLEVEDAEGKRRRVKLQIWDTAGQERFRTITAGARDAPAGGCRGAPLHDAPLRASDTRPAYYRNASAVMLAYDCTNAASFDAVSGWLRGLSAAIGDGSVTELVKALVATKCDSPAAKRAITQQEGAALAEVHAMRHYETSAKVSWSGLDVSSVGALSAAALTRPVLADGVGR